MSATILVIDDEMPLLEEILDRLRFEGFTVVGAKDGLEGWQAAQEYHPDLIVCDVVMPGMNGYDVLHEIRNDSRLVNTPFIFLTARAEREDLRRGMEASADDYLTKPFSFQELLKAIHTQRQKRDQAERERWQAFARRLVNAQDHERQQIAENLQNNIGQLLNRLKLALNVIGDLPPSAIGPALFETQSLVDMVSTRINDLAFDLWPVMLEHLGLLPALLWQIDRFTAQTSIHVDFKHRGLEQTFSLELKTAIYRIFQELLANVYKHAHTDVVYVWAWVEDGRLKITVEDHGRGFELDAALACASGLLTLQERARLLHGELTIASQVGSGTLVTLDLPAVTPGGMSAEPAPEQSNGARRAAISEISAVNPPLSAEAQRAVAKSPETQHLDGYETLTTREREILILVAENRTSTEIADLLTISPRTAEAHRANLMRKLGLRNKADIIRYALKHHLIS